MVWSQVNEETTPEALVNDPVHSTTPVEVTTRTAPVAGNPSPATPATVPVKVWDSEP